MKNLRRKDIEERKDEILKLIELKHSKAYISKLLQCKYATLNVYLKRWGVTYKGCAGLKGRTNKRKTYGEYILNPNANTLRVKEKLFEDGLKERKCEICNLTEWMGKIIPLELHHIDGNRYNHQITNLQILCSNCHSQTENHSGRALNKKNLTRVKVYDICNILKESKIQPTKTHSYVNVCKTCDKNFKGRDEKNIFCSTACYEVEKARNIPSIETLLKDFNLMKSFVQVGKKYNVSDNSVRRWCKKYKILDIVKKYKTDI
jgi:protein-arginine kinase activator protein McsA